MSISRFLPGLRLRAVEKSILKMIQFDYVGDIAYDVSMIRMVLDTDVMVSAVASPAGASRALLIKIFHREIEVAVSSTLFIEYESVLLRPERLAAANADMSDVAKILDGLAGIAIPVAFDFRWRPSGADPDDELILETAVNGQAHNIATFNLRHIRSAAARFGIVADRPGPLLRSLNS